MNYMQAHSPKSRAKLLTVVLLIIVVSIVSTIWIIGRIQTRKFSERRWKAAAIAIAGYNRNSPRGQMVKDLMQNHIAVGMPRQEVIALLGPADDSFVQSNEIVRYYIGGDSDRKFWKMLPASDFLVLEFDRAGGLVHSKVLRED